MIHQWNDDRTGWAVFSDDMLHRYRLAYSLDGRRLGSHDRIVFLMLNPSTADAFAPDPTVGECTIRAKALGGNVIEVVNLFSLRTPYPAELELQPPGKRGDTEDNLAAIMAACTDAKMVISAWGNGGEIGGRAAQVLRELRGHTLHHLGLTKGGNPKHPLARGRHRIPRDFVPQPWSQR